MIPVRQHVAVKIPSIVFAILAVLSLTLQAAPPERPNVIIIFIDDMGYGDVGFNGATGPKTPHLDRMADEGMRFDHFYVGCAVCSGSRTALLTGSHYQRLSMRAVLFPNSSQGLHPDEVTIADMLKDAGYRTACVGKWHLGHLPPCLPTYQGFESYYGVPYSNDMWIDPANKLAEDILVREGLTVQEVLAGHKKKNLVPLIRDEEVIEYPADQKTLTKRYTEESIRFIKSVTTKNKEQGTKDPFFLYLPHTMVHLPLAVSKDFENRTEKLIWDAIEEVDWSVGQILKTLKSLGIAKNTLVLFTSDNGAAVGSSLPLRARKGSVYDGGIREPTVMWWPGTIPAGKVCREVAGTIDMLPTLAGLCGGKLPKAKIDGKDIKPLMLGKPGAKSPHDHYVLMHGPGTVRSGPWKFYPWRENNSGRGAISGHTPSNDPVQLYNVFDDIGERQNLAAEHSDLVKRFQRAYDAHVKEIEANRRPVQEMVRPIKAISADRPGGSRKNNKAGKKLDWPKVKTGNIYASSQAPNVVRKPFSINAAVDASKPEGVIVAHGGSVVGYSLYVKNGQCVFSIRRANDQLHQVKTAIAGGRSVIHAGLNKQGMLTIQINEGERAEAKGGLLPRHPSESLCIGHDDRNPVDGNAPKPRFNGRLVKISVAVSE
ncbi:MAG: arylsulfatase [Verrucomicrobiales bacterium]|nr:arylsulfatase [Verrucomicrobiales bacterium]